MKKLSDLNIEVIRFDITPSFCIVQSGKLVAPDKYECFEDKYEFKNWCCNKLPGKKWHYNSDDYGYCSTSMGRISPPDDSYII